VSVTSRTGRLAASLRDGTRRDRVTIVNPFGRVRSVWVTVAIDDGARTLDSSYTLRVTPR
jgi:hypothetical protein